MEIDGQLHAPAALPHKRLSPHLGTNWTEGCVCPTAGLDVVVKT